MYRLHVILRVWATVEKRVVPINLLYNNHAKGSRIAVFRMQVEQKH